MGEGQCCGTCRHFAGQPFPKKPGWRHASGRCEFPVPPLTGLPDSVTRGFWSKDLRDLNGKKSSVWPDDGKTCPVWEPMS